MKVGCRIVFAVEPDCRDEDGALEKQIAHGLEGLAMVVDAGWWELLRISKRSRRMDGSTNREGSRIEILGNVNTTPRSSIEKRLQ